MGRLSHRLRALRARQTWGLNSKRLRKVQAKTDLDLKSTRSELKQKHGLGLRRSVRGINSKTQTKAKADSACKQNPNLKQTRDIWGVGRLKEASAMWEFLPWGAEEVAQIVWVPGRSAAVMGATGAPSEETSDTTCSRPTRVTASTSSTRCETHDA